jgi:hypothetical protein
LQKRRPDRVFGLAKTESLDRYSKDPLFEDLRHSPFQKRNMLYPFLIVEAKPEVGGPGFEVIETQTAFPIRTCVKLQEDLQQKTGGSLDPLVWFMSYEGDEWRLAAGIMLQQKYVSGSTSLFANIEDIMTILKQVIDLWMGRTTSRDGALQLFHLIDLICDWARDIFRYEILRCLAGGREDFRHASPTYASRLSTQGSRHESPLSNRAVSGMRTNTGSDSDTDTIGPPETASLDNLVLDDTVMEDRSAPMEDQEVSSHENAMVHPLLKWANPSPNLAPWTRHATIRHSNMVLFQFSHLSIPEDQETLLECLEQQSDRGDGSIGDIAGSLISRFLGHAAMTTTPRQILHLKNEWFKKGNDVTTGSESPLRAIFIFRTFIRISDWQIVRELWCISCTLQAIQNLAAIASVDFDAIPARSRWCSDMHPFSSSDFRLIHSLAGKVSATAAINSTELHLENHVMDSGKSRCLWVSRAPSEDIEKTFSLSPGDCCFPVDNESSLMEVLEKPLPIDFERRLDTGLVRASGGEILLRKGEHWSETTPKWCLLVLDELDFEDERELGRSLARAKDTGEYYTFFLKDSGSTWEKPIQEPIDQDTDSSFLDMWVNELLA